MAKRDRIGRRVLDARPDTPDFRDKVYEATLVEVPLLLPLTESAIRIIRSSFEEIERNRTLCSVAATCQAPERSVPSTCDRICRTLDGSRRQ